MADANGNLFGVAANEGYGEVYEIAKTTSGYVSAPIVVSTFNGGDQYLGDPAGQNPQGTLYADANGDLFGTAENGGNSTYHDVSDVFGTVFEVPHSSSGYASLANAVTVFKGDGNAYNGGQATTGTDGANPSGGVIADAQGDLFGTTLSGTVFELTPPYDGTHTIVASLTEADGSLINSGLIADASGNLCLRRRIPVERMVTAQCSRSPTSRSSPPALHPGLAF